MTAGFEFLDGSVVQDDERGTSGLFLLRELTGLTLGDGVMTAGSRVGSRTASSAITAIVAS